MTMITGEAPDNGATSRRSATYCVALSQGCEGHAAGGARRLNSACNSPARYVSSCMASCAAKRMPANGERAVGSKTRRHVCAASSKRKQQKLSTSTASLAQVKHTSAGETSRCRSACNTRLVCAIAPRIRNKRLKSKAPGSSSSKSLKPSRARAPPGAKNAKSNCAASVVIMGYSDNTHCTHSMSASWRSKAAATASGRAA
mmetsp:Transcript_34847/g.97278  ORF Transcript_34847/g.97278 Transcript_34847/m.97278 type:complete len:201 (+) Transcript_34847:88-690(+)